MKENKTYHRIWIKYLNLHLNRGDRDACFDVIDIMREQIEQAKLYLESEPITGDELNRI